MKRVLRRIQNGIARTGSYTGNGSGDVCIGFTTANRVNISDPFIKGEFLNDEFINPIFRLTTNLTEKCILKCLLNGKTAEGRSETIRSLRDIMDASR